MPISQANTYSVRILLWDFVALCVVTGAFFAKPLLILSAVFAAHGLAVSDGAPGSLILKSPLLVARRREGGSDGDVPLPGVFAKS